MSRIAFKLLGAVRIAEDGRPLAFAAPPKTLPLLVYLLLHGRTPLERSYVAEVLWPGLPTSQSRANLRRHLNYIKRALPPRQTPWTIGGTKSVVWNAQAIVDVDVDRFIQLSSDAHPASRLQAVDLYRGDLCEGIHEPWVRTHRKRLRALQIDNLQLLVRAAIRANDPIAVVRLSTRLLAMDPLQEDAVSAMMQASLDLGDRISAVRTYRAYEQTLRTELQLEPTAGIRALLEAVQAG